VLKIKKLLIVVFILQFSLLLTGCFDQNNNITGNAPDFTLISIYGETFTLSDHFGKIILIDLMATWCGPCHLQMPELNDTLNEFGDEILIVSVSVEKSDTSQAVIENFSKYVDRWTFLIDNYEENVGLDYEAYAIPKIVLIDKEGNIYYSEAGLTSKNILVEQINKKI
jgi:thiol-disulfide isomerase/thioredoxin